MTRTIADAEARGVKALYLLTTTAESYFPRMGFVETPRDAMDRAITDQGESLLELSQSSPRLVVFLRHAGCIFCRESLADLRDRQACRQFRIRNHRPAVDGLSDLVSCPSGGLLNAVGRALPIQFCGL